MLQLQTLNPNLSTLDCSCCGCHSLADWLVLLPVASRTHLAAVARKLAARALLPPGHQVQI